MDTASEMFHSSLSWGFPGDTVVKNLPANAGDARDVVQSLGQEDPLEKGMTTHSGTLA